MELPSTYGDSLSPQIFKHPGKLSAAALAALGGSEETQGAVRRSLEWFSRHQEPDGRWDIAKHGGEKGHDVAATSLALLCYYGWGAKHNETGPHQQAVKKALDWLIAQQAPDGRMYPQSTQNGMYDHGMATIALTEAFRMTDDPRLRQAATNAVTFIVKAQDTATGGWRYQPRSGGDTSVFGWQYMALRSAGLAGIPVEDKVFKNADRWLDRVAGGKHRGIYGYQQPENTRPAMIATGMFCRQLSKVPPTHPSMKEGALFLRGHPIDGRKMDMYYLYYGTLCLYQHQGQVWEAWNETMQKSLLGSQHKTGDLAGSWDPSKAGFGDRMGRAVSTAMATLSLEVYYRILPIYGFRADEEEPAP